MAEGCYTFLILCALKSLPALPFARFWRSCPWRRCVSPRRLGIPVRFPSPALSTDNAAMIAAAAFPKYKRGEFADFTLAAQANLRLA